MSNLTLEEMINKLDTACSLLIIKSINDKEIRKALNLISDVGLELGKVYYDNENDWDTEE